MDQVFAIVQTKKGDGCFSKHKHFLLLKHKLKPFFFRFRSWSSMLHEERATYDIVLRKITNN